MSVSLCKAKYLTNLRLTHILSSNCQIEIVKYLIVSLMACFEKLAFFCLKIYVFKDSDLETKKTELAPETSSG